jgi:hypothetical protein
MIALASARTTTPQLSRTSDRFLDFAKHLVSNQRATTHTLLGLIEKPERYQAEFVAFLCDVNTDDFRPLDTWEEFLARNVKWREFREGGMTIDTPQLVVDMTDIPMEERPLHNDRVKFSVKAHNKQLCPDVFGTWSLIAKAFLEERHGRACVIWEIEALD